jgi:exodeoxyribonuclease VII small subunit
MARMPARGTKTSSSFEQALERLEGVVGRLEDGDVPLEEALKLFEEGVRLTRLCAKKLDEAEKKVELLSRDGEGRLLARLFDGEDEEKEP